MMESQLNTDKMFTEYKDKRCLITGGAGFIGGALRDRLIQLGAHTWCADIKNGYIQDVCDIDRLSDVFEAACPHYVFHLAALTEVGTSYKYPREYYRCNVLGTANVLELCRVNQGEMPIERVVCASSDKAYGNRAERNLPCREYQELVPAPDPYSNSKRMMDQLCSDYRRMYSLPVRVLRSANTYGPGQRNETTLITNTILRLMRGECPVAHHGTMLKQKEWLYIDDAVNAYLLAGISDMNCGSVWNIGSGDYASPMEIIQKLQHIMRVDRMTKVIDTGVKQIGTQRLDTQLYSTILNASLKKLDIEYKYTDLERGLVKTVEWYLKEYNKNGDHTRDADCSAVHTGVVTERTDSNS